MKMRIALAALAVVALVALGLAVRAKLRADHQDHRESRAAAAAQVRANAQQHTDAIAAEPWPPSDQRLAELTGPFYITILDVKRAPKLTILIRSRVPVNAGYLGSSSVSACYLVSRGTLEELPTCHAATPSASPSAR